MPGVGLEPTRSREQRLLRPPCLPFHQPGWAAARYPTPTTLLPVTADPSSTSAPRRRVVIADDEGLIRLDLAEMLVELGYEVVGEAGDGERAVELVEQLRPDLVLMDINIEGSIDGIEAACRIRDATRTPIVFMTAYAEDETLARAQRSRPYGYLIKPYDPNP